MGYKKKHANNPSMVIKDIEPTQYWRVTVSHTQCSINSYTVNGESPHLVRYMRRNKNGQLVAVITNRSSNKFRWYEDLDRAKTCASRHCQEQIDRAAEIIKLFSARRIICHGVCCGR